MMKIYLLVLFSQARVSSLPSFEPFGDICGVDFCCSQTCAVCIGVQRAVADIGAPGQCKRDMYNLVFVEQLTDDI